MLEIASDKIGHVIIRSRELDMKVAPSDDIDTLDQDDRTSETIIQDLPGDATGQELRTFLGGMNVDELASLIAVAWIGRGTYAAEELSEAISTAKSEHSSNAVRYLMSLPLLPDYLEDGLDQLGLSVEDAEAPILR